MQPDECTNLALMLMGRYGLKDWTFEFDYHRTRFGVCIYRTKTISMSRLLVCLNGEEQVKDTILHEIAHALAIGNGHGKQWRSVCRAIGCAPRACYSVHEVNT